MSSELTQGGLMGHLIRRALHVSILLGPFIYYGILLRYLTEKSAHWIVFLFMLAVLVFELIRVRYRLVLLGQRSHEADHVSAFAWTMLSLCVIFLYSPGPAFSWSIIAACAFSDPLMGEMRLRGARRQWVFTAGLMMALFVWLLCATYFGTPYWLAFLIAPITVLVELPSFKWIDDNALMLLVPLAMVQVACLI